MDNEIIGNVEYGSIKEKAYINGTADIIRQLAKELDKAGILYSGRVNDYRSAVTVEKADRAAALELMRAVKAAEAKKSPEADSSSNIFGNTEYRYIKDKRYVKGDTETILRVADRLNAEKILFSGRRYGDNATITVSGDEMQAKVKGYFAEEKERNDIVSIAYMLSLASDGFEDGYYISEVNTATGEEISPYRSKLGDIPMFLSVDEALRYAQGSDIELSNTEGQFNEWRRIEAEKAAEEERQLNLARSREIIKRLPVTEQGYDEYFVLRENAADWIYFDPDGADGEGQFYVTTLYEDDIMKACAARLNETWNAQSAFIHTIEYGRRTVISADTSEFEKYALSCINSRNKENVIVSTPIISGNEYSSELDKIIDRLENHFDTVRSYKENRRLSVRFVNITDKITDMQNEITAFVAENDFASAASAAQELAELSREADKIKAELQSQEITVDDVNALRSITPARKSVQNMLENEVAQTTKFEKLLNDEMGDKSAYEMRNSDNEWRNDESKTVNIIDIQKRDIPDDLLVLKNKENIKKFDRGNFVNSDTGIELVVGKNAITETIAKAIQDKKRKTDVEARISSLYQIKELIEGAVCFDSQLSEYGENSKWKSSNTLFMHKFYAVFKYDNELYLANLSVEEFYSKTLEKEIDSTGNRLYNLRDIKITPIEANRILSPAVGNKNVDEDTSIDVTKISIPHLYALVKSNDQNFFENPKAIGRSDREAEIEAQEEFSKAMEILSEKAAKNDIEKALNIKDNPILFSVVSLDGGKDFVVGGYVDDDNVRYLDEYLTAVSESSSDTVDVQVHFYIFGNAANESVEADKEQVEYISEHLGDVLKQADLLEKEEYSVEITEDEIENSDRTVLEKNFEFTVITFEDGSTYIEAGKIDDNNISNTAAYAAMMKNNFDPNNIEDLDDNISVDYAVYHTGDGDVAVPTSEELEKIKENFDNIIWNNEPVSTEESYLHPWKEDDDILFDMNELWTKRHSDNPQISSYFDSNFALLPQNLNSIAHINGVNHYDTISSIQQIKLKGSEWLDPVDMALEMNRRGIDLDDIEMLKVNTFLVNGIGKAFPKELTPEQFAVYRKRIKDNPEEYETALADFKKAKKTFDKGLEYAENNLKNNLAEIVSQSVASDQLEDIAEKIFTDSAEKKIEIAKQYLNGAFSVGIFENDYASTVIKLSKTDEGVSFTLDNGFSISYPWSDVAAAYEQAAVNAMEWYYTSGNVLDVYNQTLQKDTADGEPDVQLNKAVFTGWVSDILARQNGVKAAYESNDKALFESTVRREVDDYFYMLCDKDESISGYALKDISNFVNDFCKNGDLRNEIYTAVAENVDISLKAIENTAENEKNQSEDNFEIYQVKSGEEYRSKRFIELSELDGNPNISDYDLVYSGKLSEQSITSQDKDEILENLYKKFNINHPEDFTGHSLSTSDVIMLHKDGEDTAHYVDFIGFKDISEFLKEKAEKDLDSPVGNKETMENAETPTEKEHTLKEGDIVTFADLPGVWKVAAIKDVQIEFENTDPNAPQFSFSHMDFGLNRENLQETLKYTLVSEQPVPAITEGTIEKYGLDIDFKNIKNIVLRTNAEEYVGGIDSDGHERRDNYSLSENDVEIYYSEYYNGGSLVRLDSEDPFEYGITIDEALTEIQDFLDKARDDREMSIIIEYEDGKEEYLDPDKLIEAKKEAAFERAVKYINEYCEREFGNEADFSNTAQIDIGYTTDEETDIPIQIYADLDTFKIVKEYGGKVVEEEKYDSLEDMSFALKYLSFDELTAISDEQRRESNISDRVWTPIPETADEDGNPTSYSTKLPGGEMFFISKNPNGRYDIEEKSESGINTIGEDYTNITSRIEAEAAFEEYIADRFSPERENTQTDKSEIMHEKEMQTAKFVRSLRDKYDPYHTTLAYEYRGYEYYVENYGVKQPLGESLKQQHQQEQQRIDNMIDNPTPILPPSNNVENALQDFFNYVEAELKTITNQYNSYLIVRDVVDSLNDLQNGIAENYDWRNYAEVFKTVLDSNVNTNVALPLYKSEADKILSDLSEGKAISADRIDNALSKLDLVLQNAHLLENPEDESEQLSMFDSSPRRVSSDEMISYTSSREHPKEEETPSAPDSAEVRHISPSDITIGDKFLFQGEEVTVSSFVGIYPDDIGVSKIRKGGGREFEVTSNVNKFDLVNYGTYLGNPEKEKSPVGNNPQTEKKKAADYSISDENYGTEGGAKTRFANNIAAIKCLKTIESEKRLATPEEQEVLAKYVGWGGIPNAFDSSKSDWSKEYTELINLLTDEEYRAARASTMNAHYTTPTVINAIYSVLDNMGFKGGNILEPAMGIGNFFGAMPEDIHNNSDLYGVELDSISGRIAKQLYPSANIQIKGYENTDFKNDSFDVAVGNVPFGSYKLNDRAYNKQNLFIHDYFFAKTLDNVRPGGIIAFVTSKGTLDKEKPDVRKYLAERAELLGAIRLPGGKDGAFKDNAGTEVTSDIIFLQKRERPISIEENPPEWIYRNMLPNGIAVNQYFVSHPEMILGEMVEGNKLYGNQSNASMCVPIEGADLRQQLNEAIKNISGTYEQTQKRNSPVGKKTQTSDKIPCPPDTPKYSFVVQDDVLYYHSSDDTMEKVNAPEKNILRIKAMAQMRDDVHNLLKLQLDNTDGSLDDEITEAQERLDKRYDVFSEKFGLISSAENKKLFRADNGYHLIKSLERLDKDGNFAGKADIFFKKTVSPKVIVDHCDNANDALILSLAEKCCVDLDYMSILTGKTEEELISELGNKIYQNPQKQMRWESADEYLTGNVRSKLAAAEALGLTRNAEALRAVIPEKINAADISVKLGSAWIDPEYIKQFIVDVIRPDYHTIQALDVKYSEATDKWKVEGWQKAYSNTLATETYGTKYMNAYEIIEATLNMKKAEVRERVKDQYGRDVRDEHGRYVYVVNPEKTMIVQSKQDELKRKFSEWIFADPARREQLEKIYNDKFNSVRLREYDGSHLNFVGMNAAITLKNHQKNAVARALYSSGNTLLAHEVGAGKTYEMIAIAMEGKRLGLHSKSLVAVPNALTEQWGDSFRTLYPNANVLVATEKDFKKENRRNLFAKIATGDWDAVIIGHSQLDMIHLSKERELDTLYEEVAKLQTALEEMTDDSGKRSFSVKQVEKSIKSCEEKIKKLLSRTPEDDMICFEKLGIDKMFIDESQNYKNLDTPTKMQNVSGIGSGGSGKSMQLLMKCKYLDEITGGKGTIFASGTPISNSMSEMYTLMRYLQAGKLSEMGIHSFDQWASIFGETTTSMELSPEGNGKYQMKTRFAKFQNLPELMNAFKECADIKTADSLNLDRPDFEMHNVNVPATQIQAQMIKALGERAKDIRAGAVKPTDDNMCKLTVDGRKIGLDQRCINPSLPDDPNSKVNVCINNVFDIWQRTAEEKSTQLIFSDLATPQANLNENVYTLYRPGINGGYADVYAAKLGEKDTPEKIVDKLNGSKPPKDFNAGDVRDGDVIMLRKVDYSTETAHNTAFEMQGGKLVEISPDKWSELKHSPEEFFESERKFCVYDDIKQKLIEKGVPEKEIAFIHDFDKAEDKLKLFNKMNKGEVRVLIGSTAKCGAGMNAQERMIALHDLDAPMRPSDMEQRHGRIIRQGNTNSKVDIFRYTTDRTFDAYLYQMLENKQKFISQIMTDKSPVRSCEDVDEIALDYAEVKALCAGNPLIKEKIDLETSITKLNVLKSSFLSQKYSVQDKAYKFLPQQKAATERLIEKLNSDIETAKSVKPLTNEDGKNYYPITVNGVQYHDKEQAGEAIREAIHNNKDIMEGKERIIGEYRGFQISAFADSLQMNAKMRVNLKCACDHYGDLNMDENVKASGNITRLDNIINGIGLELQNAEDKLDNICADIEESVAAAEAVFPQEQELTEKESRLAEVNTLLASSDVSDSSDDTEMRGEDIIDELDEDMEAEKETNSWER